MSKNYELDSLKAKRQDAFRRKQSTFKDYAEARDRCSKARNELQKVWQELCSAREVMNCEYENIQRCNDNNRKNWNEYNNIRDRNSYEIERLRKESDTEHQQMIACFEKASRCYEYGDKSEAPYWSEQGHNHKARRDDLNYEVRMLCQEVKTARQNAEHNTTSNDSSAFRRANDVFRQLKARHKSSQAEYIRLKAERDHLKKIFDLSQKEYGDIKKKVSEKQSELKSSSEQERNQILDKAGIALSERNNAKIVKKPDGSIQIYHGGLGKGDGLGHGHTTLNQFGNKTYDRNAFSEHGYQNYTNANKKDTNPGAKPSRGGWTPIERGVIFDQEDNAFEVTFRQGLGENDGQTLISDGHISGNQFNVNHNHYGRNNKKLYPNEPDRIENSSKHKDDSSYTGPGH